MGKEAVDEVEGGVEVLGVALALDEGGGAGSGQDAADVGEVGVVVVCGSAFFAAELSDCGQGLDAVEEGLVPPELALEVEGVFDPVAGMNER